MLELSLLKKVLEVNYEALGFTLVSLEEFKADVNGSSFGADLVRVLAKCPCGGYEMCNFMRDTPFARQEDVYLQAETIMRLTCNKHHFEGDVKRGLLPAFDIDKHVFKKLIRLDNGNA